MVAYNQISKKWTVGNGYLTWVGLKAMITALATEDELSLPRMKYLSSGRLGRTTTQPLLVRMRSKRNVG